MAEQPQQPQGPQIQINVERLRGMNVHFCIPCYGGQINESTFMGMIKWGNTAKDLGINWTVETLVNESLITRGRNTMVSKFLNNPNSTHLFFIDADIGFEPWHVLAVLNHDKDVCCGLYPMKTMPVQWVVNGFDGAKEEDNGNLLEVTKSGTGFMCIKKHVFEKMKSHPAVKKYNNDIGLPKELDDHMYTFFDTAVRENRYYSEDWTFCENWRDMDGEIWVDKRVHLRHTGSFVFCAEADMAVRKKMAETPAPIKQVTEPVPQPKKSQGPRVLSKSNKRKKK
jgi:hypothetical protein